MKPYLRRLVFTVVFVALAVGLAWLAVQAPDVVERLTEVRTDLADGREGYHRLRIGMSEAEVYAAIGKPPSYKGKLYGTWMQDLHWYATSPVEHGPTPGAKLYDHYQWDYGSLSVMPGYLRTGMLLEDGRVVCFWYTEEQQNPAEYALEKVARKLSLNPSMLRHSYGETSHKDRKDP